MMQRRRWTAEELDYLRAHYRKLPASEIASKFGRTKTTVYQTARKLGLACERNIVSDEVIAEALRELNPQGYTDTEVTEHLIAVHKVGVDRHRVSDMRKSLCLAFNKNSQRFRDRVRANTRRQLTAAGITSMAELRKVRWKQWKQELGWPEDLTVRAVQALEMLYRHGPQTRVGLCLLMGVSPKKRTAPVSNAKGGTVLAELQRAGLVTRVRKAMAVPFDTKTNDQHWGNRERSSDRVIRFKHLDLYMLNPGVQPNGRQTADIVTTG